MSLRDDERTVGGENWRAGLLGPASSSLTLAWLASHRDRLRTLLLGGKHLSVLVIWDRRGAEPLDHSDAEVDAMNTIVHGKPKRPTPAEEEIRRLHDCIAAAIERVEVEDHVEAELILSNALKGR